MFFLSLPAGGGLIGRGLGGGKVARRPSLSLVALGRFLPLLGFPPSIILDTPASFALVGPASVDNGGVVVVTLVGFCLHLCVCLGFPRWRVVCFNLSLMVTIPLI